MNIEKDEIEIDLGQILKVLLKRLWIIILATIIFGISSFMWTKASVTPLYNSNVKMYVNGAGISIGDMTASSLDLNKSKGLVSTYIVILKTRNVLEEVIEKAELSYSYETLLGMLNANSVDGTEIFQVNVTSSNPSEAMIIANTVAEVLPEKISEIVAESTVSIVDYAVKPAYPISPNPTRNATVAGLVGAFIAAAVIVLLHLFDQEIKCEDELLMFSDIPVLAVVPDRKNKKITKDNYYYTSTNSSTK